MKAEIIILLERKYTLEEIQKLFGLKNRALLYYYNKQYKKGIENIDKAKKNQVKIEEIKPIENLPKDDLIET